MPTKAQVYYTLFPYDFYRDKEKIARLSVKDLFIQQLKRECPKITFQEARPFEEAIVIYGECITDIPNPNLVEMVAAWAGGKNKIKKVVGEKEFKYEMKKLNEDLN